VRSHRENRLASRRRDFLAARLARQRAIRQEQQQLFESKPHFYRRLPAREPLLFRGKRKFFICLTVFDSSATTQFKT
jgi:hypothetical protein